MNPGTREREAGTKNHADENVYQPSRSLLTGPQHEHQGSRWKGEHQGGEGTGKFGLGTGETPAGSIRSLISFAERVARPAGRHLQFMGVPGRVVWQGRLAQLVRAPLSHSGGHWF